MINGSEKRSGKVVAHRVKMSESGLASVCDSHLIPSIERAIHACQDKDSCGNCRQWNHSKILSA